MTRFETLVVDDKDRPTTMYKYYVSGSGNFPFDMLRFDQCWPATDGDTIGLLEGHRFRSVQMLSWRPPTIDRWLSFGWSVGKIRI